MPLSQAIEQQPRRLASGLLCVLALLLIGKAFFDYQRMHDQTLIRTQQQLRLLHDGIRDQIAAEERTLTASRSFLIDALQGATQSDLSRRLGELIRAMNTVDELVLLNTQGQVVAQASRGEASPTLKTPRDYGPTAPESWPDREERIARRDTEGPSGLYLRYRLLTPEGRTVGLLMAHMDFQNMSRLLASLHLGADVESALVDPLGELLASSPGRSDAQLDEQYHAALRQAISPNTQATVVPASNAAFPHHYQGSTTLYPAQAKSDHWPVNVVTWVDYAPAHTAWVSDTLLLIMGFLLFSLVAAWAIRQANEQRRLQSNLEREARAQEAYQQERFHLATQSAGIGVWEYDLSAHHIRWDSAMCQIHGVPQERHALNVQEWLALIVPEHQHRLQELIRRAPLHHSMVELHFDIHRQHDQATRNIQSRAKVHADSEGQALRLIGVSVDITQQRQFEGALRDAEERFRSSFEWAAIGMAILSAKGHFIQVNNALCGIVGYSRDEMLSMSYEDITHPQDTQQHLHLVKAVFHRERNSYQLEKRYRHKEGHVVWVTLSVSAVREPEDRVAYFIAQVQDITERKRQEAALIEREHFLRTLSECLPGLVSYWSTDLRCHFANRNHEKWIGLPSDKVRGLHLKRVLGEENFKTHAHHYQQVLGGAKQRFEVRKALPTGGYADVLVHLIPDVLYGRVEGFFSISTNITDFKAQQRELERINVELVERTAQAESANRAKGAFLANMSHEIRTPMNAIMGLLQLMQDMELPALQRDYLQKIGSAADVLLNVLNDILDISRVEANKLELDMARFELDTLLSKSVDLFSYRAEEKQIRLFCTKDPSCPSSLVGDRLRLAQVLNNLLSNALKFTEHGHIHLNVKPWQGNDLLFSVRDTGMGMSPNQCSALFQPFSQVDDSSSRRYGGAGLGLSICKNLVELMGGTIWVESTLGEGTTFHFTLPCLEPDFTVRPELALPAPVPANPGNADTDTAPLAGVRVLVADDHKLNRMVAQEMLRKWGAEVTLATNGVEAVEACREQTFELVLMDLQMPEMDGHEATRQILAEHGTRAPKIVAVTASATAKDREAILRAGMCDHVIKPFRKEDLLQILQDLSKTAV